MKDCKTIDDMSGRQTEEEEEEEEGMGVGGDLSSQH
jgi:hypothetical protein